MLQFPNSNALVAPLRRNDDGKSLRGPGESGDEGLKLYEVALRCILVKKADWYAAVKMSAEAIDRSSSSEQQPKALLLGPVDCMPHSIPLQVSRPWLPRRRDQQLYAYPDHAIAIVGAAGRFPGSETLGEFWETIRRKESKIGTIPERRGYAKHGLNEENAFRGNYLTQEGAFDHAFFRKSPREASYMDPQHRLALHLAYETLESSGYFSPSSSETKAPEDVGCYIGISSADYQDNVNSQPPTAFSFTGTARAFAPGRISHFFGWTGPSLAIDTACSSSMVAMHTAVRAIQSGECSMALAGGLNLITSPKSHHNLGGASFLSPSGQCSPFDAAADGYCRGEGAGFVLMKRLSAAVADNDHILGVIVGSATNNSKGNTSITVPSSESQSSLYLQVLQMAGMQASQVSYVEAHGTGTQKGDPVECESIQKVFGGAERRLRFGSVKGNIGHSEAASGVASLIKVLLMLQHGQIPPQANLSVLNPALGSLEEFNMEIPQRFQPWNEAFRVACVNNYGASGSNAAMIVCQPPPQASGDICRPMPAATCPRYPFLITAHSGAALQRYRHELASLLEKHDQHLSTVAFNLAQKQNHALRYRAIFQAASLTELKACIKEEANTGEYKTASKPVVLVFAGQTGHRSRLSREAYYGSLLLQRHLDRCDRVLQSLGLRSLFPHIFEDDPIDDLVDLHCMQFSVQYAAASAWIDAGLAIEKVIGHSLGQLTAMCVAGAVTLRDGLKLVSGRAALIQTNWGPERGCMLSVDADIATVHDLLASMPGSESPDPSGDKVEIACYNSASNHIVVGSEAAISRLEDTTRSNQIRSTRLPVTHGFHSHMVDSIMEDFSELVRGIKFSSPKIPLEPCANLPVSWADITPEVVARQSREPVYFSDAVARVEKQLGPSCIWLEAGSGPIGVTMVRRALESLQVGSTGRHSFHSIRLQIPDAIDSLATTTTNLWKEGVRVQFWPYHTIQRGHFGTAALPSYQFETSHHWLQITNPEAKDDKPNNRKSQYKHLKPGSPGTSSQLISFLGLQNEGDQDSQGVTAVFSINQHVDEYSSIVHGRTVLGATLAPSSLWLESATRALRLLSPTSQTASAGVRVDSVKLHAGFGMDLKKNLRLTLRMVAPGSTGWDFEVESHDKTSHDMTPKLHVSGTLRLQVDQRDKQDASQLGPHGRMLHRLIDYRRCLDIREDPKSSLVQGTFVRKVLSRIAAYTPDSFGVRSIATRDAEAVAQITMPLAAVSSSAKEDNGAIHPLIHDNCLLVAEMHASNLDDCPADEMYICHGLDAVIPISSGAGPWTVYSKLHHGVSSSRSVVSDVFVFDDRTQTLAFVILGASFHRISTALMETNLKQMTGHVQGLRKQRSGLEMRSSLCPPEDNSCDSDGDSGIGLTGTSHLESETSSFPWFKAGQIDSKESTQMSDHDESGESSLVDIKSKVASLVREITACVPETRMDDKTCLSDLGVDSLSATELQARVKDVFHIDFPLRKWLEKEALTLSKLCQEIQTRLTVSSGVITKASSFSSLNNARDVANDLVYPQTQPIIAETTGHHNHYSSEVDTELKLRLSSLLSEHLNFPADSPLDPLSPLGDMGLDSLVAIQLKSDMQEMFGKLTGKPLQLGPETTFEDLCNAIRPPTSIQVPSGIALKTAKAPKVARRECSLITQASSELQRVNDSYGLLARETRWSGFYASGAHQEQLSLVVAYITEAFSALGCDLAALQAKEQVPVVYHQPKYQKLITRFHHILREEGLIELSDGRGFRRTTKPLPGLAKPAEDIYGEVLRALPEYSPEHQLLHVTAPHLADCLSGKQDPLELLFSNRTAKQLLTDVYVKAPLFATGNRLLSEFLGRIIPHHKRSRPSEKLRVLEIGGGTGGTTHLVLQKLIECDVDFAYTFTDISAGLVATTRRALTAQYGADVASGRMEWTVLNVEEAPATSMMQQFDLVISANCIHATRDLDVSCANIRKLLRPEGGILCLLELTRPQPWLDCVFGLLDGWWRFEDGRTYALADERQWDRILRSAGFFHVGWSDDESRESNQLRLITALSRD